MFKIIFLKDRISVPFALGVAIRIGRYPVQTPLGSWLSLETQLHYKGPGDFRVKIVQTQ